MAHTLELAEGCRRAPREGSAWVSGAAPVVAGRDRPHVIGKTRLRLLRVLAMILDFVSLGTRK